MECYEVSVQNRINVGMAIGWSYYSPDGEHNYNELVVYVFLLSIIIRWI